VDGGEEEAGVGVGLGKRRGMRGRSRERRRCIGRRRQGWVGIVG
jgi:hypothetical protein